MIVVCAGGLWQQRLHDPVVMVFSVAQQRETCSSGAGSLTPAVRYALLIKTKQALV
ncbi:hypothetical protein HCU01_05740 [Halomonas cupida]|uniref:Uncharacterized protein n=1 Tax=Halomonas cupida TaxID=44933 RepID=A0ABQ0WAJ3_9GAMM|nr:hypothetical protein HCU01_05740 [Halomonas cupida]